MPEIQGVRVQSPTTSCEGLNKRSMDIDDLLDDSGQSLLVNMKKFTSTTPKINQIIKYYGRLPWGRLTLAYISQNNELFGPS